MLDKTKFQENASIVHFLENREPQNNTNVHIELKGDSNERIETTAQDSYLPSQGFNFEDQPLTTSGNKIKQPSLELQPPSFGENGDVNYYSSSRSRQSALDLNRNGEEPVLLPSEQPVQITNSSRAVINFGLNLLKVSEK